MIDDLEKPIISESSKSIHHEKGLLIFLVFLTFQLSISIAQLGTKLINRFYLQQVMFIRSAVGLIFGTIYLWRRKTQWLPMKGNHGKMTYGYLLLRSFTGYIAMIVTLYAVRVLHLTEAEGLLQSAPMCATLLARIFLKEELRILDFFLAFLCFIGVLVIAQRNDKCSDGKCEESDSPHRTLGIICGVLSSILRGFVKMLIRLSGNLKIDNEIVVQYYSLYITIFSFFGSLFYEIPQNITFYEFTWLLVIGILGWVGQMCMTYCYQRKPVIEWMCYEYVKIIFSIILDLVVFSYAVPSYQIFGCFLIACSGIVKYISTEKKK